MVNKNWTPRIMFEKADQFFVSLGLPSLPPEFWSGSNIETPEDDNINKDCNARAWDFRNGKDFRIHMCTKVTQEDFATVHHEIGHVQQFLHYQHLSFLYQDAANPGFHEGRVPQFLY